MKGFVKSFTMREKIMLGVIFLIGGLSIAVMSITYSRSQVMSSAGLAVAQSTTKWNHLKDVAYGDAQTTGLAGIGPYVYDQTNTRWDRMRGDATNGVWVNVKTGSISSTVTGSKTPADSYSNPTDAVNSYSLNGIFNGTTWDRLRGDATSGAWVNVKASATPSPPSTGVLTLLNAVTGTGAGTSNNISSTFPSKMTWQYVITGGTLSALTINLEGSIDNTNWFILDTTTQVTDQMRHIANKPILYVRANITSWTVGTSTPVLTCKFIGGGY
jgi:hypothetical protein